MISPDTTRSPLPLCTTTMRVPLRQFMNLVTEGRVSPAGPPGGPDCSGQQRIDLWDSLEAGWPIGLLTVWRPDDRGPYHLLDGHRRTGVIVQTTTHGAQALLRDLSSKAPAYRAAAHGARCLPTTAMFSTLNFLTATGHLPADLRRHAERIATRVHQAPIDILSLSGGTPWQVHTLCGRLLGTRVALDTVIALHRASA